MIIELGNHAALAPGIDERPKVTTVHFPEADADGLGGYTHEVGAITADDFKEHLLESISTRQGVTQLPSHEILMSILHPLDGAWGRHAADKPAWVHVSDHELTPEGRGADVERFLCDYWGVPAGREYFATDDPEHLLVKKELQYWTRTEPGELAPGFEPPPLMATYTNNGRVISNVNDGGGKVGLTGQATAAGATSLTTASTFVTNEWAGYRVYVTSSAGVVVWGNVISNTNAASSSVLTVDRWYAAATPGGAAATTPASFTGSNATFILADGGTVSTWFVGLATGANATAAADTTLSTNGNVEIVTGGGGLIRKIAPYAQTSGVATRAITLTPIYTANGSDSLPATVTTIGVFCSMVVGTAATMKFETTLNASATLSAIGDQLTVTETVNGS